LGLRSEDWGGKTIMLGVSAKTKQGIDALLEMVLLEAEMLELKANINKSANGVVIEGRLSRGKGPVATVLVKNGTLKEGDNIVIGSHYGKVRAMITDKGEKVPKALPSIPVEISGLSGVPLAGEQFYVVDDEQKAKTIFQQKELLARQERFGSSTKKITLEDIYTQIKEGKIKELKLILKTDVQGSLEAVKDSLNKMSTDEVKVDIIHSGVGIINDADIILAAASNAIVIGFNAGISPEADERIKKEGVDVRLYRIIYDITSDIKSAMEGLLEPKIEEVFEGRALVKQVFNVTKAGVIAGCMVQKGAIGRTDSCRLLRDSKEVYKGKINSLKRFKDDVKEVKEGFECGIGLANFNDIKAGDIIEAFTIKRVARKL
jgi:translation initiation factor IF-2